ncbi:MAG: FtsX-like permease family protein, partial [bacterium]|nr:FtsX-like permease family protein [bacterium]
KYFATDDPVGQMVVVNDSLNCLVTGVLKDIPQNTQLFCEVIISYATLTSIGHDVGSWDNLGNDYVYLLANEGVDPDEMQRKITTVAGKYLDPDEAGKYSFRIQALKDIYFNAYSSGNMGELRPGGEISLMYEVGIVALFVLLQAIANFINLSTARSADRAKEVGVRKVFGASRAQLVRQYIGESMVMSGAATLIAVALYEALKFKVSGLMPREQLVDFYADPWMLLSVIALMLIVGVLGGFYPALYLSRFRPITVLQSKVSARSSRSLLRKSLVVLQFGIAALFVFCTITIIRQHNFVTSVNVGFDTENMLIMDFEGENAAENCALMKNEVLLKNRVLDVSASNCPPGRQNYRGHAYYKNEQRLDEDLFTTKTFEIDYDFISTFGLEIVEGKAFSREDQVGAGIPIIVTEAAVEELEVSNAIGHKLYGSGDRAYE